MKIAKLKQKNVLVKIMKAETLKKVKGLYMQPGKTAYLIGEIVDIGDNVFDDDLQIGKKVLIHAQSITYEVDAPELGYLKNDKEYDYFILFHEQCLAILEEDKPTVDLFINEFDRV